MNTFEVWTSPARLIGHTAHVYERLDSTNKLALELGDEGDSHAGLVLIAKEQTAGRGQHGRSWWSPSGSSLLMSAILFPPETIRRPVLMTALAAVAVCETIAEETGLTASIKWPNDVLIDGKKVCGILIEQRKATVIGIGLNLLQGPQSFRAEGLTSATSLFVQSGNKSRLDLVWASLCKNLDRAYQKLLQGKPRGLELRWQRLLGLKGRSVLAETHSGDRAGTIRRIGFDAVHIEDTDGVAATLIPETIRHLTQLED